MLKVEDSFISLVGTQIPSFHSGMAIYFAFEIIDYDDDDNNL
jgi:hypothetical protein